MAFFQAILTMLFRQMGRLLNTVFSWATTLLFGKVPEKRQTYLSVIGLASVLWLVVALGVAFPRAGAFLLAFIPLPDWVSHFWVRMLMLALALTLPLAVGFVSLFLVDAADRPKGARAKARAVLKGYPYTVGLALTLLVMFVVALVMKARDLLKGWTSTHVPVVVESRDYLHVVRAVRRVLRQGGLETVPTRASWLLRWPTRVFTFFAGGAIEDLVAEELTVLEAPRIEVLLHPSDLVIRGPEADAMRAHAIITENLNFTRAYLTWSREAHELEDRLSALWRDVKRGASGLRQDEAWARLRDVERDLRAVTVSYEEWEVLFREKLLVERGLLQVAAGREDELDAIPDEGPPEGEEARQAAPAAPQRRGQAAVAGVVAFAALVWSSLRHRKPTPA